MNPLLPKFFVLASYQAQADAESVAESEQTLALHNIIEQIRLAVTEPMHITAEKLIGILEYTPAELASAPISVPVALRATLAAAAALALQQGVVATLNSDEEQECQASSSGSSPVNPTQPTIKYISSIEDITQVYRNGAQDDAHCCYVIEQASITHFIKRHLFTRLAEVAQLADADMRKESSEWFGALRHGYLASGEMHAKGLIHNPWTLDVFSHLAKNLIDIATKELGPRATLKAKRAREAAPRMLAELCKLFAEEPSEATAHFALLLVQHYGDLPASWSGWDNVLPQLAPQEGWSYGLNEPTTHDGQTFKAIQKLMTRGLWHPAWQPAIISVLRWIMSSGDAKVSGLNHVPQHVLERCLDELSIECGPQREPLLVLIGALVAEHIVEDIAHLDLDLLERLSLPLPISAEQLPAMALDAAKRYASADCPELPALLKARVRVADLFQSTTWMPSLIYEPESSWALIVTLLAACEEHELPITAVGALLGQGLSGIGPAIDDVGLKSLVDTLMPLCRAHGNLLTSMIAACIRSTIPDSAVILLHRAVTQLSNDRALHLSCFANHPILLVEHLKSLEEAVDNGYIAQASELLAMALVHRPESLYTLPDALATVQHQLSSALLMGLQQSAYAPALSPLVEELASTALVVVIRLSACERHGAGLFTHTLAHTLLQKVDLTEDVLDALAEAGVADLIAKALQKQNLSEREADTGLDLMRRLGKAEEEAKQILEGSPALLFLALPLQETLPEAALHELSGSLAKASMRKDYQAAADVWRAMMGRLDGETACNPTQHLITLLLLPAANVLFSQSVWTRLTDSETIKLCLAAQTLLIGTVEYDDSSEIQAIREELMTITKTTFEDLLHGPQQRWHQFLNMHEHYAYPVLVLENLLEIVGASQSLVQHDSKSIKTVFARVKAISDYDTAAVYVSACTQFLLQCLQDVFDKKRKKSTLETHTLIELLITGDSWSYHIEPELFKEFATNLTQHIVQLKHSKHAKQCLHMPRETLWAWLLLNHLAANVKHLHLHMLCDLTLYPDREWPEVCVNDSMLVPYALFCALDSSETLRNGLIQLPHSSRLWSVLTEQFFQLGYSLKTLLEKDQAFEAPPTLQQLDTVLAAEDSLSSDRALTTKFQRCALALKHQAKSTFAAEKKQDLLCLLEKCRNKLPKQQDAIATLKLITELVENDFESAHANTLQALQEIVDHVLSTLQPVLELQCLHASVDEYHRTLTVIFKKALSARDQTQLQRICEWITAMCIPCPSYATDRPCSESFCTALVELYREFNAFISLPEELNRCLAINEKISASLGVLGALYPTNLGWSAAFFAESAHHGDGLVPQLGIEFASYFLQAMMQTPSDNSNNLVLPPYNVEHDYQQFWRSHVASKNAHSDDKSVPAMWTWPVKHTLEALSAASKISRHPLCTVENCAHITVLLNIVYFGLLRANNFDRFLKSSDTGVTSEFCALMPLFINTAVHINDTLMAATTPDREQQYHYNMCEIAMISANLCLLTAMSLYREKQFDKLSGIAAGLSQIIKQLGLSPQHNLSCVFMHSLLLDATVSMQETFTSVGLPIIDEHVLSTHSPLALSQDLLTKSLVVGSYLNLPELPEQFRVTILNRWCEHKLPLITRSTETPFAYPFGSELLTRTQWELQAIFAMSRDLTIADPTSQLSEGERALIDWTCSDLISIVKNLSLHDILHNALSMQTMQQAHLLVSMRLHGSLKDLSWHGDPQYKLQDLQAFHALAHNSAEQHT